MFNMCFYYLNGEVSYICKKKSKVARCKRTTIRSYRPIEVVSINKIFHSRHRNAIIKKGFRKAYEYLINQALARV